MPTRRTSTRSSRRPGQSGSNTRRVIMVPRPRFSQASYTTDRYRPIFPRKVTRKMITQQVKRLQEIKLLACAQVNEQQPVAGLNTYAPNFRYAHFVLGSVLPNGWDPQAVMLSGTTAAPGTGTSDRIGSYIFLKKTTLNMDIDMNTPTSGTVNPPVEFRVIVLKPKKGALQSGYTLGPHVGMFLNSVGGEFGYNTVAATYNSTDYLRRPINKRNFKVLKDQRFVLSSPSAIPNAEGYSGKYGCTRNFRFTLPMYKKVKYDSNNNPYDIDTHFSVIILARSIGKDHVPDNWEVNMRGTTSFTDY